MASNSAPSSSRQPLLGRIALLCALFGLTAVGLWQLRTPASAGESAPEDTFSAGRAMGHLEEIAGESRAIGTPGNRKTRRYLADQIESMGLEAEVQRAPVHVRFPGSPGFSAGRVNNVVTRIPGTDNTGAIVVNAHYDSGTTGPGASDCGSCVVTALESMRAILAGEPLRNDVIFVFSDGEENGDLGAAAFVREHPWAKEVELAVNYEAQGSSGPAFLYATSERDGWLVSEFFREVPGVVAWSWIGAISEAYPAGQFECDLAEYMKGGIQGLGFLYTSDTVDYHTVGDNLERIDPGSIQQEGDYTMAFLRHFGQLDLSETPRWENRVFFSVLPGLVVHYPYGWAAPLAVLVTLLGVFLIGLGFRREKLSVKPLLFALGAVGVGTLVAVAVPILTWMAIKRLNPVYDVILIGHYQADLYVAAFVALSVGMVGGLYALTRRFGAEHATAAVFLLWLPLLWGLSLALPAMSYIATWPLLFVLLPLAWLMAKGRGRGWSYVGVLGVAAAPVMLLLPGTLYQAVGLLNRFEGAMGMPLLGAVGLFVVPVVLLMVPHLEYLAGSKGRRRWWLPAAAGLVAVGLIGWGNLTAGFDEQKPRPNHIAYQLDANDGQAQWVSFDRHLDDWTGTFFAQGAQPADYETAMWGTFQAFTAPADAVDVPGPEVRLVEESTSNGERRLALRFWSPRGAPELRLRLEGSGPLQEATLDGRPLDLSEYAPAGQGILRLNYVNVPEEGVPLAVTVDGAGPVDVIVEDSSLGLPDSPAVSYPPRPADTMPAPSFRRDATEVRKVFEF